MDPAVITLAVLGAVAFLFITEIIPMAVTAVSAAVVLGLCGVLSAKEVFSDIGLIRNANLRLPRVAHLFEILDKEDHFDSIEDYPLTISEARHIANDLFNH